LFSLEIQGQKCGMRNDNETPDTDAAKSAFAPLVEQGLFKSRTVLVTGEVNDRLARQVCERLLAMAGESDDPITVIVSSPGGHVESGDMIHDMIKFIKPRVRVLGTGWVASAGALIYVAANLEDRYTLPNTRGSATEIDIQAREVLRMRERLNRIFAEATGQPLERIVKDTNRDYWMSAEEAKEYGVVGKIIRTAAEIV